MTLTLVALIAFQGAKLQTPQDAVNTFLVGFNRSEFRLCIASVQDGKYSYPAQRLEKLLKRIKAQVYTIEGITLESSQGDDATVRVRCSVLGKSSVVEDVKVRRSVEGWRIVVGNPAELGTGKDEPPVKTIAAAFVYPTIMLEVVYAAENPPSVAAKWTKEMREISHLGKAVLAYGATHSDTFPGKEEALDAELKPLAEPGSDFTERLSLKDDIRWRLNPELLGKRQASIPLPEQTVMLYEEVRGTVGYRYSDDRALVVLANGTPRLVTQEEAYKLRWTPSG